MQFRADGTQEMASIHHRQFAHLTNEGEMPPPIGKDHPIRTLSPFISLYKLSARSEKRDSILLGFFVRAWHLFVCDDFSQPVRRIVDGL